MRRVVRGIDRSRVSVVLLDPSSDVRWVTRAALEEGGRFQVVGEAGTGAAGVALAGACDADLVLLDLTLPAADGLETVARLRAEVPRAAIVLFTCSLRAAEVQDALGLGALGVVRKGAPLVDVVTQVGHLFASRHAPSERSRVAAVR